MCNENTSYPNIGRSLSEKNWKDVGFIKPTFEIAENTPFLQVGIPDTEGKGMFTFDGSVIPFSDKPFDFDKQQLDRLKEKQENPL